MHWIICTMFTTSTIMFCYFHLRLLSKLFAKRNVGLQPIYSDGIQIASNNTLYGLTQVFLGNTYASILLGKAAALDPRRSSVSCTTATARDTSW